MKPIPAPPLPEGTPGRLDWAFRTILTISKAALLKEEPKWRRANCVVRLAIQLLRDYEGPLHVIPKFTEVCGSGNTLLAH
jgi:hypothetical protein